MNAIIKKVNKDLDNQDGILSKELIVNTKYIPVPISENNGKKPFEVNKIKIIDGNRINYTRDINGIEEYDLSEMNIIPPKLTKIIYEDTKQESIDELIENNSNPTYEILIEEEELDKYQKKLEEYDNEYVILKDEEEKN